MSGPSIGIYSPNDGYFVDSKLKMEKGKQVGNFKTSEEAEKFAKNRAGAEVIELKNGNYEVYELNVEQGKSLNNQEFLDNRVSIKEGIGKEYSDKGVKRAYLVTTDNVVRTLDDKTTQLSGINQEYIGFKGTISVEDKDGIDKNSQKDLNININGNVKISKQVLEEALVQLNKQDFDYVGKLDFKLEVKDNKYEIAAKKGGVALGYVTLEPGKNGLDVNVDFSALAKGVGYVVAGPLVGSVGMSALKDSITGSIKDAIKTNTGLIPSGSGDTFTLKPDFQNNGVFNQIPVGNMKMSLDQVDQSRSTSQFSLDGSGINMKVNLNGVGSSDPNGQLATVKPEDDGSIKTDKISAGLDASVKSDYTSNIAVTNGSMEAHISKSEKDGFKKQLSGFGKGNYSLTGDLSVSNINTSAKIGADGKATVTSKSTIKVASNQINFEDDKTSTKVNIKSASGSLSYEPRDNGGFGVNLNESSISGNIEKPDASISVTDLKAKGSFSYIPAHNEKDTKGKETKVPETYRIEGAEITSGPLQINKKDTKITLNNLDLKNASVDITPTNGGIKVESKKGAVASINNLKIGKDLNVSGTIAGSVSYDPNAGVTIKGETKNLRGKIGDFNFSDFDAKSTIKLNKNNELEFTDVSRFNLNFAQSGNKNEALNGLNARGQNLKISQEGSNVKIGSEGEKTTSLTLFYPKTKTEPEKDLVKDLKFSGQVNYDKASGEMTLLNPNKPFSIHSGSIAGVEFKDFKATGDIKFKDTDNALEIKSPLSFDGTAKFNGVAIKDAKFLSQAGSETGGSIKFDKTTGATSFNGQIAFKMDIEEPSVKGSKVPPKTSSGDFSLSGNIEMKRDGANYVVESKTPTKINTNIMGMSLENLEFQGKLVIDPKTKAVTLEKPEGQNELTVKGKINGKDVNIKAEGNITFGSVNNETVISANNFKMSGEVAGMNIKPIGDGLNGKITLSKDSKLPKVEGLSLGMEVDGIKFETKGSIDQKASGNYVINVPTTTLQGADSAKVTKLLDKVSDNFATTPEQKKKIQDLKGVLSNIDFNKVKLENFNIELDKDLKTYKVNLTATDLDLNIHDIPERNISIKNTPSEGNKTAGKINFQMDEKGEVLLSSEGTRVNATINGNTFKDFDIKGGIKYSPAQGNAPEKFTLSAQNKEANIDFKGFEVKGDIVFNGGLTRKVEMKADADVSLIRKGNDLEFEGSNMKLEGMFSDFKVKSLPLDKNSQNPTFASGKLTVKEDGHLDLSKLNFRLDVEGIEINNRNGSFSSKPTDPKNPAKREYDIKIDGGVNTDVNKFINFLGKVSNDKITPQSARESLGNTMKTMERFFKQGSAEGKYDMNFALDENFNLKSFKTSTEIDIKNAEVKLDSMGMDGKTLKIDNLKVSADSEIPPSKKGNAADAPLYVKEGNLSFDLSDSVKAQLSSAIKDTMTNMLLEKAGGKLGVTKEDINLNVNIGPSGDITIDGNVKNARIINSLSIGGKTSFDGTKVNISIDKVKAGNFIGTIIQHIAGATKDDITEETVKALKSKGVTTDYNGKTKFSIDLQNILSQATNNAAKIKDFKIENNKVTAKYEAVYGEDKKYDPKKIADFTESFNKLSNTRLSDEEGANLINQLNKLSPQEMSMSFERISFSADQIRNLAKSDVGNENASNILMKKLFENRDKSRNKEHLIRIIDTMSKENKDTLRDFIAFIKSSNIENNSIKDIVLALNRKVAEFK